jgi:deferrochelatase/peroxidase EfeB
MLSPDRDDPAIGRTNDYTYLPTDPIGLRCPIGAHTRRANPIDAIASNTAQEALQTTNRHRIMRRAVYFGEHVVTPESFADGRAPTDLKDDGKLRGMHFFAINAEIERQFEFVQQSWCNSGSFNGLRNGKDPVIGNQDGTGVMTIPLSPLRREMAGMPRFVSVMGGAYFFLPGIAALRYLAS